MSYSVYYLELPYVALTNGRPFYFNYKFVSVYSREATRSPISEVVTFLKPSS